MDEVISPYVGLDVGMSNVPTGLTLADFDFAFQPAIERSRIDTLGTCVNIRDAETERI